MRRSIYEQIDREYEHLRDENQRKEQQRREEVYQRCPDILGIDRNIRKLGFEAVKRQLTNPQISGDGAVRAEMENLRAMKESILVTNGFPRDYLEPIYTCPYCHDEGFLEDGSRCTCYVQKLARHLYEMSNLERMIARENFATFDINVFSNLPFGNEELTPRENMAHILEDVKIFIDTFDEPNDMNLLFYGTTGLGKTFLSNAIARELLDRNYTVVYQTAFTLLDILEKRKFHDKGSEEVQLQYELLFNCDLLIIDDLGTELSNNFTNSEIFNIVNTRLIKGKKILISTNLTPQEISRVYSDRIFSRIFDKFVPLKFFGPDLRWE